MLKNRTCLAILLAATFFAGCDTFTTKKLLRISTTNVWMPQWPSYADQEMQISSYDRHSVSPDQPGWFANADASQYIRTETTNGRKENVMMDVDGPGVIVRFWLTTFKRHGKIRIYFDNQAEPEITVPAYDLMQIGLPLGKALLQAHSSYEPLEKGGSTLYLPMPYAKHCKVTFEDEDKDNQPRYYQINYRNINKHIKVETFSLKNFSSIVSLANQTNYRLLNPARDIGPVTKLDDMIKPQAKTSVDMPEGASAIRTLSIKLNTDNEADYQQALRSTILKIEFDGEQTVWCPVGDFSGSGVGGKPLKSWYRVVTKDGEMICRWIMPYQKTARITLLNLGDKNVYLSLKTTTATQWHWSPGMMYFHADWKEQLNVPIRQSEKDKPEDWVLNSIEGQGVFVGETFAVYNHMHKWYGEGDQKLWVDGENFPSEFGTGTEDYYNTSWAPVVLYQTPFANAPRADNADSFGYNTFTRTRNLDAVPFKKSFKFTLEILGWENGTADFAATTYWYGFKGAKSSASANQTQTY